MSNALVASSKTRMDGLRKMARANTSRCLSPPDSRIPRSPMSVSRPCGSFLTKSAAAANSKASQMVSSLALGSMISKFSLIVALNRNGSCGI